MGFTAMIATCIGLVVSAKGETEQLLVQGYRI